MVDLIDYLNYHHCLLDNGDVSLINGFSEISEETYRHHRENPTIAKLDLDTSFIFPVKTEVLVFSVYLKKVGPESKVPKFVVRKCEQETVKCQHTPGYQLIESFCKDAM